ncbi:MAG: hypothetical protein A2W91_12605 [Bacteroidetes bacterium GWF2_38_335]|nr:MAG: hypothetical protein A2W91_12605 [Bacteroidetes bacterium GWF2_38_335]OFY77007.1 MAG: hypothetical protein A2281_00720 [Bacteroidetes bacterium RIFOXYA12_FULL_38_20]HBS86865.1 hypothetical protein [Bacteroidales bacterium]
MQQSLSLISEFCFKNPGAGTGVFILEKMNIHKQKNPLRGHCYFFKMRVKTLFSLLLITSCINATKGIHFSELSNSHVTNGGFHVVSGGYFCLRG